MYLVSGVLSVHSFFISSSQLKWLNVQESKSNKLNTQMFAPERKRENPTTFLLTNNNGKTRTSIVFMQWPKWYVQFLSFKLHLHCCLNTSTFVGMSISAGKFLEGVSLLGKSTDTLYLVVTSSSITAGL